MDIDALYREHAPGITASLVKALHTTARRRVIDALRRAAWFAPSGIAEDQAAPDSDAYETATSSR